MLSLNLLDKVIAILGKVTLSPDPFDLLLGLLLGLSRLFFVLSFIFLLLAFRVFYLDLLFTLGDFLDFLYLFRLYGLIELFGLRDAAS